MNIQPECFLLVARGIFGFLAMWGLAKIIYAVLSGCLEIMKAGK